MKIRIFALAKELGLDSKELIEYANAAGVEVKNSALASISPEEKDLVLAQIQAAQRGNTSTAVKDDAAPVRRDSLGDRAQKIRSLEPGSAPTGRSERREPLAESGNSSSVTSSRERKESSAPDEEDSSVSVTPSPASVSKPPSPPKEAAVAEVPQQREISGRATPRPGHVEKGEQVAARSDVRSVAGNQAARSESVASRPRTPERPPATQAPPQSTVAANQPGRAASTPAASSGAPVRNLRPQQPMIRDLKSQSSSERSRPPAPSQPASVAAKPEIPPPASVIQPPTEKNVPGVASKSPTTVAKPATGAAETSPTRQKPASAPEPVAEKPVADVASGKSQTPATPPQRSGRGTIERMDKAATPPSRTLEPVRPAATPEEPRSPVNLSGPRRGPQSGGTREMRPVGTVQTNAQGNERQNPKDTEKESRDRDKSNEKKRPQLARPIVAAPPKFTPARPKVEPTEGPAQKPDVLLTPGMMKDRTSPLSAHLASRGSEKKPGGGGGGRGRAPGGGFRDLAAEEKEQAEALKRRRAAGGRGRRGGRDEGEDEESRRRTLHRMRSRRGPIQYSAAASITGAITVRSLSEAMGRPAKQLLGVLFKQGQMVSINDPLDEELAVEIAMELGVDLAVKRGRSLEEELQELLEPDTDPALLETRPPVVTILGHVDHGKTTLVDKIRSANIAGGEAGGITQHIAAYQVEHNGQKVTFVDTPGHAAFGEMRARGANVTDVVVLVVAANDGVMPQTEESISHARAAGVPIIVALNKIDLPGIDENRALQSLAQRNVLPAEWGGDVEVIRTSGLTGKGLDDLLDTILISTELRELKANPDRPAIGVCLEAFRDEGRGPIAWIIVQSGTLEVGDTILCGSAHGRVRAMYDDKDQELEFAGPSTPVKIAGLDTVPESGARFFVVNDVEMARELASDRQKAGRAEFLASQVHRPQSLEELLATAKDGEIRDLPLIIKADTPGSIEAIRHELAKLDHPEVRIRLIHTGVGGVNESDVSLASASGAVIVAFHVVPEDRASQMADREGVDIRRYSIIYEVADSIRSRLEGLLKPELREVATGRAIVLQTFKISRTGMVAGCRVLNGTIERNNRVHLIRQQTLVSTYSIGSLRREKDDVREVREGMECGIRLENFNDLKEGDLLEAFRIDEVKRKFE